MPFRGHRPSPRILAARSNSFLVIEPTFCCKVTADPYTTCLVDSRSRPNFNHFHIQHPLAAGSPICSCAATPYSLHHAMPHPVTQPRSVKSFLVLVCLLAFAIRLAAMFAGNTYRVVEDDTNHFGFGWEMGRVAASLAEGQ